LKRRTHIDLTIERLRHKRFKPDPISGKHFSRIVSLISSACKRHGFILERAILEQLKTCPRFDVWEDKTVQVTPTADHIVDTMIRTPDRAIQTDISPRWCPHSGISLAAKIRGRVSACYKIDHYGQVLVGCIDCNRYGVTGEKKADVECRPFFSPG